MIHETISAEEEEEEEIGAQIVAEIEETTEVEVGWIVAIEDGIRWNETAEVVRRGVEVAIVMIVSEGETRIDMASGRRRRRTNLWDR